MKSKNRFSVYTTLTLIVVLLFSICATVGCGGDEVALTPPDSPTGVVAVALSSTSIRIAWDAMLRAEEYEIYMISGERVEWPDVGWGLGITVSALLGTTGETSYVHSGLIPKTTYNYYITAINGVGRSPVPRAGTWVGDRSFNDGSGVARATTLP